MLKPFLIGLFMMFFLQMSGFNVMVFYCVPIFNSVGVSIDPNLASIIVGATLLLSCFVALAVVSQLGRKVVLVTSILGMAACNILLGTCYHLQQVARDPDTPAPSYLGWLPILAVVGFLFLGNVGYGTLVWVVTAELLPPKVNILRSPHLLLLWNKCNSIGQLALKEFLKYRQTQPKKQLENN